MLIPDDLCCRSMENVGSLRIETGPGDSRSKEKKVDRKATVFKGTIYRLCVVRVCVVRECVCLSECVSNIILYFSYNFVDVVKFITLISSALNVCVLYF